jgi:O-antigen/teichoic acid export membrane protein
MSDIEATQALGAYIVASILAFAIGAYWLWRAMPLNAASATIKFDIKTWRRSVGLLSLTRGGRIALNRMDIIFVGALAGAEAAGVYRVATAFSSFISFGVNAINAAIGPYLSRLHVNSRKRRMKQLLIYSCLAGFSLAIAIVSILGIFGQEILALIYSQQFSAAYIPLLILATGHLVNSAAGPVGMLLNMTGQERWSLVAVVSSLTIAVPAYVVIVPIYGYIGAAIVAAGSLVIVNAILTARSWIWLHGNV